VKALVLALVLAALPFQGTVDFKPKVGQKLTYETKTNLEIAGNAAVLQANIALEAKKVDDKGAELEGKWSDLKLVVADNDVPVEVTDSTIELSPAGHPRKVRGGIEGSNPVHLFLVTYFVPPEAKDLTVGMKYTVEVPEVKDEVPAYKFDGEYVGKEVVDGKELHKFKGTVTAKGDAALESKQTVWARPDGVITRVEADFKNMDVPAAGSTADGKATLILKS
jgi:hypothetical protein